MNLSEIKFKLRGFSLDMLKIIKIRMSNSNIDRSTTFKGLDNFKNAIDLLDSLPIFKKETSAIKSSPLYYAVNDEYIADGNESDRLEKQILNLSYKVGIVLNLLDEILPREDENAIRIKLPPAKDFEELSKVMNEFKRAISIPIQDDKIGGEVTIERAEPGSIWLLVLLRTKMAVQVVSELCWSAMVLMKQYKSNQFVNEQIREYKIENDMKEVLLHSQKKLLDQLVQTEASNIQNKYYDNQQKDQTERLVLSIKTIHDLFLKGAEIKPSLNASPEIIKSFPLEKETMLIESRVKQITEGSDGLSSGEGLQSKS